MLDDFGEGSVNYADYVGVWIGGRSVHGVLGRIGYEAKRIGVWMRGKAIGHGFCEFFLLILVDEIISGEDCED